MRPTTKITPAGSSDVFEIKTYATAQEKRDVQEYYSEEVQKLPVEKREMTGLIYGKLQDATIRAMLVTVNGKKDGDEGFDALGFLLALPSAQFDEVFDAIKEALDGEKKKVS